MTTTRKSGEKAVAAEAAAAEAAAAAGAAAEVVAPGPAPDLRVICHIPGGRRRAGRAWDGGETQIVTADLTAEEYAALKADPMFTLIEMAGEGTRA